MESINRNVKYGDIVWVRGADTRVRQVTVLGGVKKSPELFIHFGRVVLRGEDISDITDYEVMNRIHITHPPQPAYKDQTAGAEAIRMQAHEIAALQQKTRELEEQLARGWERERALDQALARVKRLLREASPQQRLYRCERPGCPGGPVWHEPGSCNQPGAAPRGL